MNTEPSTESEQCCDWCQLRIKHLESTLAKADRERDRETEVRRAAEEHIMELRAALDEKPYMDEYRHLESQLAKLKEAEQDRDTWRVSAGHQQLLAQQQTRALAGFWAWRERLWNEVHSVDGPQKDRLVTLGRELDSIFDYRYEPPHWRAEDSATEQHFKPRCPTCGSDDPANRPTQVALADGTRGPCPDYFHQDSATEEEK